MPASVNYNIVGESAPFTFSVKDMNGVEKFLYISNGKIYFTATQNGTYTVVVSKGDCHISNQIIVNNCETVPTPSCTIPELSIVSIIDKIVTFNVTNTSGCNNLEFQSSTTSDFSSYVSFNKTCQTLNNIEFFQNGNYYVRVIKTCTNGLQMLSNIVSVAINPVTPVTPVSPVTPTSNCLKVYAINNSSLTDIITFILCDGSEQSYTLAPYSASPEVCIINENSWTSNTGETTIYNRGTC